MEDNTILKDFRKKIFEKESVPDGLLEYDKVIQSQEKQMNKLLKTGSQE